MEKKEKKSFLELWIKFFSGKKRLLVQVASKYLRLERLHRLCRFIGGK